MIVLDLDLDFFLTDCCPLAKMGERPDSACASPWKQEDVIGFLENNLRLNTANPIPGIITKTHDGALQYWRSLIRSRTLKTPFSVVHIDAHSDLGIGFPGPGFVLNNILGIPPQNRDAIERYYEQKKLDEANYLLFALAFRWIDSLTLVRDRFSRADIPPIVKQNESGHRSIQLESYISHLFAKQYGEEPEIDLCVCNDPFQYHAEEPFVCMNLACSPRYAPKETDALIPVISKYMHLVSMPDS